MGSLNVYLLLCDPSRFKEEINEDFYLDSHQPCPWSKDKVFLITLVTLCRTSAKG